MNAEPQVIPHRTYILSDTLGGFTNPLRGEDPDVRICKDFNGLRWMGQRQPREININGRNGIGPHVLRLILSQHDRAQHLIEGGDVSYTGVFLNHAERTETNQHGGPFYVAETDNNVRIVITPLVDLASIRQRIIRLWELPNEGNELFPSGEQFRSQYTPALLPRDHGVELIEHDPAIIPEGRNGSHHVAFVDGDLNVITWLKEHDTLREQVRERAQKADPSLGVLVGSKEVEVLATTSLEAGRAGQTLIYENGDGIDLVGKWAGHYTTRDKIRNSAYWLFNRPEEGYTPVSISW